MPSPDDRVYYASPRHRRAQWEAPLRADPPPLHFEGVQGVRFPCESVLYRVASWDPISFAWCSGRQRSTSDQTARAYSVH